MDNQRKNAVGALVDASVSCFAEGLFSRYSDEKDKSTRRYQYEKKQLLYCGAWRGIYVLLGFCKEL